MHAETLLVSFGSNLERLLFPTKHVNKLNCNVTVIIEPGY